MCALLSVAAQRALPAQVWHWLSSAIRVSSLSMLCSMCVWFMGPTLDCMFTAVLFGAQVSYPHRQGFLRRGSQRNLSQLLAELHCRFSLLGQPRDAPPLLLKPCMLRQDLRRANFTAADIRNSQFKGANLQGAYLIKAVAFRVHRLELRPHFEAATLAVIDSAPALRWCITGDNMGCTNLLVPTNCAHHDRPTLRTLIWLTSSWTGLC